MQTPRIGVLPGLLAALVLTTVVACGGDKKDGASAAKTAPKTAPVAETKTDDVKSVADGAAAGSGGAGSGQPGSGGSGAAGSGGTGRGQSAASASGGTAAGTGGGQAGADAGASSTGGADGADSTGGGPDVPALLKELKSRRTRDKRATAIIAELEAAEVETMELAKALTARGKALFASPERATAMFELALDKDPKIPDPAFELAKQAAMLGESELEEAKKWLKVVHERKGKKFLKQIEFDPMWEILKDDPDVRAMLR